MTNVTVCRAKDPSKCRFHGSLEAHVAAFNVANDNYLGAMRDLLADPTDNVTLKNRVARWGEKASRLQASVDSHDVNFDKLVSREAELRTKLNDGTAEGWDDSEYNDTVKRIEAAKSIRDARTRNETNEELGWKKTRVAEILKGSRIMSGETITSIHYRAKLPSGKREVYLKDPETGNTRAAIWNANTMVDVIRPKIFDTDDED